MKYLLLACLILTSQWVLADDFRPASLTIQTLDNNQFDIVFKVPIKKGYAPNLAVIFDENTKEVLPKRIKDLGGSYIQMWRIQRNDGLSGMPITIDGLKGSNYDVIVRVPAFEGGVTQTQVLTTERTTFTLAKNQKLTATDVLTSYLILGFDHILVGLDHLLFVFALILIVIGWQKLIWTITFFTLAHSFTLAAVTLNWFKLPAPPVEAVIALSIIFLAKEIISVQRGKTSLTARYPWVVAFIFGLLHGMGFAGALSEIGVPENEVFLALLSFNIGVELGQLTFVVAVLLLISICQRFVVLFPKWFKQFPAYSIGTIASFWLLERLMML